MMGRCLYNFEDLVLFDTGQEPSYDGVQEDFTIHIHAMTGMVAKRRERMNMRSDGRIAWMYTFALDSLVMTL